MSVTGVAVAVETPHRGPSAPLGAGHVPAFDGVRGIAILLVLIYHFVSSLAGLGVTHPALKVFELGWSGVDVFFALSGFLITGILLDTRTAPNYFRSFYTRRILRIFPLYYAAIVAVILLQIALPEAGIWGERDTAFSPGSLAWPAAFLENVAIALEGKSLTGVMTHYWSLAVEEHFYMVWPFVIWLARTPRQVLAFSLAAVVIALAGRCAFWLNGTDVYRVFALTPLRLDGLAIGAAAAVLIRGPTRQATLRWAPFVLVASVAALAALVLGRHTLEQTDPAMWLFAFPLVALGTSAALVVSTTGGWLARLLSLRLLRWFGKYSFGLYVWHPILGMLLLHSSVALVTRESALGQVMAAIAFLAALNLVVAWLSYNLWERHFLALKGLFSAEATGAASAAERVP
jgi:peptidoglycan/LPS O-acetylase OafA/YrhL